MRLLIDNVVLRPDPSALVRRLKRVLQLDTQLMYCTMCRISGVLHCDKLVEAGATMSKMSRRFEKPTNAIAHDFTPPHPILVAANG